MTRTYVIVSVLIVSSVVARGEREAFLDVESILEAWEGAYGSVQSMHVAYSEHVLSATPPADTPDALEDLVLVHHVDRYEAGTRYHIRYSISEGEVDAVNTLMEHAFDGKSTFDYWGMEKRASINRGLTGRNTDTMNHVKRYLLMDQRPVSGELEKYFRDKTAPHLSKCIRLGFMYLGVRVLPNLERVADEWCHVIDIGFNDGSNFRMKVWLAHNKNMIPLKYVIDVNGRIIEKMEVLEIGMGETDSGSTFYPKVAQRFTDVEGHGIIQYKLDTRSFEPDIEIGSDEFSLSFPNGTLVRDWTLRIQYVVRGGGNIDEIAPLPPRKRPSSF